MTKKNTHHTHCLTAARTIRPGFELVRKVSKTKKIQVLLHLARSANADQWVQDTKNTIIAAKENGQIIKVTQATWEANGGASPEAVAGVKKFSKRRAYRIVQIEPGMCAAVIEGTHAKLLHDFGSDLVIVRDVANPNQTYIQRVGDAPKMPPELTGLVKGVHMSAVPVAKPKFQIRDKDAAGRNQGFNVKDISTMYSGVGGRGPRIKVGVGELGGGFLQKDFDAYNKKIGTTTTKVGVFTVQGGKNTPMGLNGAGGEVYLDLDSLADLINILFGFGPNTSASIATQTYQGVKLGCHIFSWSWGMHGSGWSVADRALVGAQIDYATCVGSVVCFAQGDTGPVDGNPDGTPDTDFGGEYPEAWSGGGTLRTGGTGPNGVDTYWNEDPTQSAGGYGESSRYPAPKWQAALGKKGRWCPDGSITADPKSGIDVLGGGQEGVIGGTSDVPLWAREVALVSEALGMPIGIVQPWLYKWNKAHNLMKPVLDENGNVDERCGLGTPIFANWLKSLQQLAAATANTPIPAGFVKGSF
jgi:kumamolisin